MPTCKSKSPMKLLFALMGLLVIGSIIWLALPGPRQQPRPVLLADVSANWYSDDGYIWLGPKGGVIFTTEEPATDTVIYHATSFGDAGDHSALLKAIEKYSPALDKMRPSPDGKFIATSGANGSKDEWFSARVDGSGIRFEPSSGDSMGVGEGENYPVWFRDSRHFIDLFEASIGDIPIYDAKSPMVRHAQFEGLNGFTMPVGVASPDTGIVITLPGDAMDPTGSVSVASLDLAAHVGYARRDWAAMPHDSVPGFVSAILSPDGRRLVWIVQEYPHGMPDFPQQVPPSSTGLIATMKARFMEYWLSSYTSVWVSRPDGSGTRRVATLDRPDMTDVQWCPDNHRISYFDDGKLMALPIR